MNHKPNTSRQFVLVICLTCLALVGKVKADEDSAYDENPNYGNIEDASPAYRHLCEVLGYMTMGAMGVMLTNWFQTNRDKKEKEKLEKYQRTELEKFEKRYAAGLTKWNTTSQKTKNQAGGQN